MCFCNQSIKTPYCNSLECHKSFVNSRHINEKLEEEKEEEEAEIYFDKEKSEEVLIDLSNSDFLKLAMMAHEKDITFNQLCNDILNEYIESTELI